MNRREAERLTRQHDVLCSLGFTSEEAEQLRRISMTLRRWHERECGTDNGCIERDEVTGKAYWVNGYGDRRYPIPDREKGALNRLTAIMMSRNTVNLDHVDCYIQGDPRGAALYILRPGDVPEGQSADSYYTRGICVY